MGKGATIALKRHYKDAEINGYVKQSTYADIKADEEMRTLSRQNRLSGRCVVIKVKKSKA